MKKSFFLAVFCLISAVSLKSANAGGDEFPLTIKRPKAGSPSSPKSVRELIAFNKELRKSPDLEGVFVIDGVVGGVPVREIKPVRRKRSSIVSDTNSGGGDEINIDGIIKALKGCSLCPSLPDANPLPKDYFEKLEAARKSCPACVAVLKKLAK